MGEKRPLNLCRQWRCANNDAATREGDRYAIRTVEPVDW